MKYKLMIGAVGATLCLLTTPALADSKKDIETISKAVSFMNGGPSGDVEMAVVFDPSNPDSVAHADEIAGLSSGGVGSKVKLNGAKVSAASVGGTSAPVIFLTRGSSAAYSSALSKAKANGGLTVSTDSACLGSGCVMVVQTQPSVDISVSTDLAASSGVEFASAFSMMITKK